MACTTLRPSLSRCVSCVPSHDDRTLRTVNRFPPIAEYAFLSNCEADCLVAPDGSVEWMCLPRPDCPSIFGSLLDRSAGFFRFAPSATRVPAQRRYMPGTNVTETTWHVPTGWLHVYATR